MRVPNLKETKDLKDLKSELEVLEKKKVNF